MLSSQKAPVGCCCRLQSGGLRPSTAAGMLVIVSLGAAFILAFIKPGPVGSIANLLWAAEHAPEQDTGPKPHIAFMLIDDLSPDHNR